MKPWRATHLVALTILTLGFLYVATVIYLTVSKPPELEVWFRPRTSLPFSEAAWNSFGFGQPERYKMANDLVSRGHLIGISEEEVTRVLGSHTSEHLEGTDKVYGYDLVSQRQFPSGNLLLPKYLFLNTDTWLLEVKCRGGRVIAVKMRFT